MFSTELVAPSQSERTVRFAVTMLVTETRSLEAPAPRKRASSFTPGGPPGDQFAGVSQNKSVPLAPVQRKSVAWENGAKARTRKPVNAPIRTRGVFMIWELRKDDNRKARRAGSRLNELQGGLASKGPKGLSDLRDAPIWS